MSGKEKEVIKVTNRRYCPKYHIFGQAGWINDPNGLVYFKGYYHVFYQYYPYGFEWGPMHWGHVRSKDLVNWENLPIALTPGSNEDKDGCFSGSAIVKDNRLYLIYTGNNVTDKNDPNGFYQVQNLAFSDDGIHFEKYKNNPIIAKQPKGITANFRDPKVWERDGKYYLIVGSEDEDKKGRALLYSSEDLIHWEFLTTVATSKGNQGEVWECPDLFRLNGKDILLTSPQGISKEEKKYLNVRQTGYFVGDYKYNQKLYQYDENEFQELDKGHDFYATQTMLTPDGRRVLFGWLDMWFADMPEQPDGWAGMLTFPRELTLKNNHLYMRPIQELAKLRQRKLIQKEFNNQEVILKTEDAHHSEFDLDFDLDNWAGNTIKISFQQENDKFISLTFNKDKKEFTLYREGEDPYRYGNINESEKVQVQILVDSSSMEFFINDGELVFSERFYKVGNFDLSIEEDKPIKTKVVAFALGKKDE